MTVRILESTDVRVMQLSDILNPHLREAWNTKKQRARALVSQAVKLGILKRPDRCSDCGLIPQTVTNRKGKIHAHHENYDKPLDVIWVCSSCHNRRHGYGLTSKYPKYA